jgi:hypothetical protein
MFFESDWKTVAPFLFSVVMVLLASWFGAIISVAGSLLAAVIFAMLLFPPLYSLRVDDESAWHALAWMILFSVSLSYLLYPSPSRSMPSGSAPQLNAPRSQVSLERPDEGAELRIGRHVEPQKLDQTVSS